MAYPYFKQRELRIKERCHEDQRIRFDSLLFGIASPEQIRSWAQRTLPNGSVIGEVSNGKTVDYKTLKPLKGGLFCQRTFGPMKDFICACGKGPKIEEGSPTLWFCPTCEVEFQPASIRRHRMGYIELGAGCVHLWYYKSRPNYLSILLAKKPNILKNIIYSLRVLVNIHDLDLFPPDLRSMTHSVPDDQCYRPNQTIPFNGDFFTQISNHAEIFGYMCSCPESDDLPIMDYCLGSDTPSSLEITPEMDDHTLSMMSFEDFMKDLKAEEESRVKDILNRLGGQALANIINQMDLSFVQKVLATNIQSINVDIQKFAKLYRVPKEDRKYRKLKQRRLSWIRRYKLINTFLSNQRNPAWMVLFVLPVLPPTLRPIIMMENGVTMASDINRLYQRVAFRNTRMLKVPIVDTNTIGFSYRLLQEAVESVFENGKGDNRPVMGNNNRQLAALVDRLKGKRGRFRLNLLGKRMDYSARSVIVVGPKMSLHECGLPREIALRLFRPFLLRRLLAHDEVTTFKQAHDHIKYQNPLVWNILSTLLPHFPVLLNRAPTLHRLGIQAFQPRIVSSQAIALHPLVCTGFNADFDGDQMAVHMPLSFHARAEAWKLLWSRNNLLGPANGDPILAPSQDMILGSYYLTKIRYKNSRQALLKPSALEAQSMQVKSFEGLEEKRGDGFYFTDIADAIYAFYQDLIKIRTPIWLRLSLGQMNQTGEGPQSPIEVQIQSDGFGFVVFGDLQQHHQWPFAIKQKDFKTTYTWTLAQYAQTTIGRILVNQLIMGKDNPEPGPIVSWIKTSIHKIKREIRAERQDEVTQFEMKSFLKNKEYEIQDEELLIQDEELFNELMDELALDGNREAYDIKSDDVEEEGLEEYLEDSLEEGIEDRENESHRAFKRKIRWMLGDLETSAELLFSPKKKVSIEKLKSKVLKRIVDKYRGFISRRYYKKDMLTPQDIKVAKQIYFPALQELIRRKHQIKLVKLDNQQVTPDKPIKLDDDVQEAKPDGQG